MIVVSGTVEVRPDMRAHAVELIRWLMAETVKEPGCKTYRFYADLEKPELFRVFEEWESAAALAAHSKSAHMAEFYKEAASMLAGAPEITKYEVVSSEALG